MGPYYLYMSGCVDTSTNLVYAVVADDWDYLDFHVMEIDVTQLYGKEVGTFTIPHSIGTFKRDFVIYCDSVWHKLVVTFYWELATVSHTDIYLFDPKTNDFTFIVNTGPYDGWSYTRMEATYDSDRHILYGLTSKTNAIDMETGKVTVYPTTENTAFWWTAYYPLIMPDHPDEFLLFNATYCDGGGETISWWNITEGVGTSPGHPEPYVAAQDYLNIPAWVSDGYYRLLRCPRATAHPLSLQSFLISNGTRIVSQQMTDWLVGTTFTCYIPE